MPVRMFRNKFALEADQKEKSGATPEEMKELLGKKREMAGIFEGNIDEGELEMGQSSGLVKDILPVKDLITRLQKEFVESIKNL